jgi:hypothetical protein
MYRTQNTQEWCQSIIFAIFNFQVGSSVCYYDLKTTEVAVIAARFGHCPLRGVYFPLAEMRFGVIH